MSVRLDEKQNVRSEDPGSAALVTSREGSTPNRRSAKHAPSRKYQLKSRPSVRVRYTSGFTVGNLPSTLEKDTIYIMDSLTNTPTRGWIGEYMSRMYSSPSVDTGGWNAA